MKQNLLVSYVKETDFARKIWLTMTYYSLND